MVQKMKCELQNVKYKIQCDLDSVGENLCMFRKKNYYKPQSRIF